MGHSREERKLINNGKVVCHHLLELRPSSRPKVIQLAKTRLELPVFQFLGWCQSVQRFNLLKGEGALLPFLLGIYICQLIEKLNIAFS